ncbi:DUF308 domain-containing protein [Saccharothrix sp. S26]|uniref:HdeD family acid-resistance protein n=1 Tax=Saccharothrix sp. S26 TaxID=2907215 RepID=UPI001F45A1EA|nr:DUF308 domain-containing protein [Saccharothrix sp. S26]MCE7000384.1 DUF308 domain-containing protein [Saccharothrix sp. S26]
MTHPDANTAGQVGRAATTTGGRGRTLWITFGVITLAIGLAVLLWPGLTLLTAAVLFGLEMLVTGLFWLVGSFTEDELGRQRWLLAVAGLLALVAGILCLRAPFRTITVLALLLGATWVVGGVAEVFHGVRTSGWAVLSGVVTAIGGIVVLVWPVASLIALAWLLAVVLIVLGAMAIAGGVGANRKPRTSAAAAPTGTTATA